MKPDTEPRPRRTPRVSRFNPRALYWQAADLLRARIVDGTYPPGQPLPSEPVLRAELGTSQDVVRRALALLRTEGLVHHRPGHGNLVRAQPARQRLPLPPATPAIARMPTPGERARLDLPDGVPVLVIAHHVYPGDRYELHAG